MADPIDIHVGNRIRRRRKQLDITQEQLAKHLSLTFQQVQKYERGTNRVSASKLYEIARCLKVQVGWFFDGLPEIATVEAEDAISAFAATTGARDLARAWLAISPKPRLKLRDLAVAMAGLDEAPATERAA